MTDFSADAFRRSALALAHDALQARDPSEAAAFLKTMPALKAALEGAEADAPQHAARPPEAAVEAAAEALFRLAARLAFGLLQAPETLPAAFAAWAQDWRAAHLPTPDTGAEAERIAAAAMRAWLSSQDGCSRRLDASG